MRARFLAAVLALATALPAAAKPVAPADQVPIDLRRTTLVVRDMEKSLAFYRDALGLKVIYDQPIRTPRAAKDDASAERATRLVFLRANDDFIGVLGLYEYRKPRREPRPPKGDDQLRPGDVVLVFNLKTDNAAVFERASKSPGARPGEAPNLVAYPGYDSKSVIRVMFSSAWDPDGHYVELNQILPEAPKP